MKSNIDLHLHTLWSDGEDSTEQLLDNVIASGIKIFSITDHDTIKGNIDFLTEKNIQKLKENNVHFITGIEVSSICNQQRIHILGFDYDINSNEIKYLSDLGEKKRKDKTDYRIKYIAQNMNIVLSQKSIDYLNSQNVCAKPHFAKCFYEDGYAESIIDALKNITPQLPKIECSIDYNITVKNILSAGGIPVWAHPLGGINEKRLTRQEFLETLDSLVAVGLKGIECYYSLYDSEEINFLLKTAKKYGLAVSCGSDYHGKNVKKVTIGEVCCDDTIINEKDITVIGLFKKNV